MYYNACSLMYINIHLHGHSLSKASVGKMEFPIDGMIKLEYSI